MLYSQPLRSGAKFFEPMQALLLNSSFEYRVCFPRFPRHEVSVPTQMVGPTDSPVDPSDTMLPHYLIATWAKVCQAMGPEFEPYLPVVMPPLFRAANAKADVSVYGSYFSSISVGVDRQCIEDEDVPESKEGWDIIEMDGQQVGIRTSAIDEKCQAFETLVIYCSTLGARFAPYLQQSLEMVLQSLRFVLHDGVREACAMCVAVCLFSSCWPKRRTQCPPNAHILRQGE